MILIPKDTLAFYEQTPFKRTVNSSKRALQSFVPATKLYLADATEVSPDVRAIEFYATNHYYSLLKSKFSPNEKLPAWAIVLAEAYRGVLTEQAERMLHYLVCITTREARHLKTYDTHKAKFQQLYGAEFSEFVKTILGLSEMSAIERLLASPPNMVCGQYFRGIGYLFSVGWGTGKTSFGGPNWAAVTKPLADFIQGQITAEMMVDIGYTLAHNNGPIFNKGMMFSQYTGHFKTILDVQRSGQIPELVKEHAVYAKKWGGDLFSKGAVELTDLAYKHFPEAFGQFVDWHKVEAMGALGKYDSYKAAQPVPKIPVAFGSGKALEVGKFKVTPQQSVMKMERVQ